MGDKGDKSAARPSEGSLVETRCLIKGPKSAIVPFAEPRSGLKSRTGSGVSQKAKSQELAVFVARPTEGPLRPKDNSKFACRAAKKLRASGICCSPHRTGKYGTKPFYGGSGYRAVAHTHPAGSKYALGPVGIPLIRGASGAGR